MNMENLISKKMRIFAERNDWMIRDSYIYGKEQGHLFTGIDGKGIKSFITPVPGILRDQTDELMQLLEKNSSTMRLEGYDITDGFLCIRIKDSTSLKTDDIEFILALLSGILSDLSIVTANRCQECGELGADKETYMYDLFCYMHDDCATKFDENEKGVETADGVNSDDTDDSDVSDPEAEAEEGGALDRNNRQVSTLRKVLFTLAGALIGSIPWLIMPYIMDMVNGLLNSAGSPDWVLNLVRSLITCICAYLISYFAIVGYKLSGAGINKSGRWMIGIISIAFIIIVQFAYLAVLILKEPSVKLTFGNYMTNLVKYNFYRDMLIGAGIGTVFALIAVLPFFDSSKGKTSK